MSRYGLSYRKTGMARYLSHLDLLRTFERAMRRANLPLAYTQGFNPHPKISFAAPLSVGIAGLAEYLDVELLEFWEPERLLAALENQLPSGLKLNLAFVLSEQVSLMAKTAWAEYQATIQLSPKPDWLKLQELTQAYLAQPALVVNRATKAVRHRRGQPPLHAYDIRPGLPSLALAQEPDGCTLTFHDKCGSEGNIKPAEVIDSWLEFVGLKRESLELVRTQLWGENQTSFPEFCQS
ncbi:MAG: TIGR03936 family radical SAM-associated protein [Clostridia bacterium]|nr:TIGR03936 family radical SAM-associated protein [Clostridia bacterium]